MSGNELTPGLIRYGYSRGAFPMAMEDGEVQWFRPRRRALFPISGIRVSHSLRKVLNRVQVETPEAEGLVVRFDTSFEMVMRGCLRPFDNWISEEFVQVYTRIHREGWGHCAECWLDGELVGGAYGVSLGSAFCAESMFHRHPNASKVALWAMVERCRTVGFTLFDAQIMNPHLLSLGAYEVSAAQYRKLLDKALAGQTVWDGYHGTSSSLLL